MYTSLLPSNNENGVRLKLKGNSSCGVATNISRFTDGIVLKTVVVSPIKSFGKFKFNWSCLAR